MLETITKNEQERRRKISESLIGNKRAKGSKGRLGQIFSEEHRRKLSLTHIGKILSLEHKKKLSENNVKYWLGKKRPEVKNWLIPLSKGIYKHTKEAKEKISESHSGEKHYRWNYDRETVRRNRRDNLNADYHLWARMVKKRDKLKCKLDDENCSRKLEAHHILPWSQFPDVRYDISSGITLCQFHHPRKRMEEQRMIPVFRELVEAK